MKKLKNKENGYDKVSLKKLENVVDKGEVKEIYVSRFDILNSNSVDTRKFIDKCNKKGVKIHSKPLVVKKEKER